jgi:single-stranded-DNA-specific exonuclease
VVRLDHTNRILVEQGLARLRVGRAQPGVAALFAVAGRDPARATAFDLGFVAGPRLNAAGRLADMSLGIACLLTDDTGEAMRLAAELDRLNRERREVEASIQDEAMIDLDALGAQTPGDRTTVCLYRAGWHQGVVGIVASRVKDAFNRPTIIFGAGANGELKGSGRSIAGFHLRDALDLIAKRKPGVIDKFGGHAFAAGLTLAPDALPAFIAAFEQVGREQLTQAQLLKICETDGGLDTDELTIELAATLRERVWGQGMPAPLFDDTFDVESTRIIGGKHTRMILAKDGERFEAIAFRCADALPPRIHAVFRPEINHWQGNDSLQLVLEHWQPR